MPVYKIFCLPWLLKSAQCKIFFPSLSLSKCLLHVYTRCKPVSMEGILKLVTGDGMGDQDYLVIWWLDRWIAIPCTCPRSVRWWQGGGRRATPPWRWRGGAGPSYGLMVWSMNTVAIPCTCPRSVRWWRGGGRRATPPWRWRGGAGSRPRWSPGIGPGWPAPGWSSPRTTVVISESSHRNNKIWLRTKGKKMPTQNCLYCTVGYNNFDCFLTKWSLPERK